MVVPATYAREAPMASLRARHSKMCALAGRETSAPRVERDKIDGCTCKPMYSIRGAAGQGYEPIGRDLRSALRALAKRQADEDEGLYRAIENLRFEQWADRWLELLERPKENT